MKTELLAQRVESDAAGAKYHAEHAKDRAEKVKVTIQGCLHKINVETETINSLKKKIGMIEERTAKYNKAAMAAKNQNSAAATKKAEAIKARKNLNALAKTHKSGSNRKSVEFQAEQFKVLQIEAAANELETAARKATSEERKARLEFEEALAASEQLQKHSQALVAAEAYMLLRQKELENREALVKARYAQAAAKNAEARLIRAGNKTEAEKKKHEARVHRATALEKENAIREQASTERPRRKTQKQQPIAIQLPEKPTKQARCVEKKYLSANGLLTAVHATFQEIIEIPPKKQKKISRKILLCDCLMSGLALFGLKYPSLLQFDQDSREGGCIEHNLKTLYKVNEVPSDTYMRECLDNVDPVDLRPAFKKIFAEIQRGKVLEEYAVLDGHYLVAGDGSGYYSSKETHCQSCCKKHHQDGTVSYYHQMMSAAIVHPDYATVIPFCPEPILNSDGAKKNDCERNAAERMYRHIRREHPHLSIIATEDAIGSNGPHIRLFKELDMRFILVVKPDGNKYIFEFLKGIKLEEFKYLNNDGKRFEMRWINDIPLNEANDNLRVNFFEVWVYGIDGQLEYHNSWVTDIFIAKSNVYQLVRGGRAKWKIENETFNTLKNQGYNFEHNFGHGYKHLTTIFAMLMFLAFLIDQVQQFSCGLFQMALEAMESKTRLWSRMRAYFMTLFIDSWEDFFQGIAYGIEGGRLIPIKRKRAQDTS